MKLLINATRKFFVFEYIVQHAILHELKLTETQGSYFWLRCTFSERKIKVQTDSILVRKIICISVTDPKTLFSAIRFRI